MAGKKLRSCDLTMIFSFKRELASISHNNCSLPSEYHHLLWCHLVGFSLQEDLKYLQKRAKSGEVTERELHDINLECTRVNLRLELCLLKHDIASVNLTLEESHGQMMRDVRDELSSGTLIQTERLDELLDMLSGVRCVT